MFSNGIIPTKDTFFNLRDAINPITLHIRDGLFIPYIKDAEWDNLTRLKIAMMKPSALKDRLMIAYQIASPFFMNKALFLLDSNYYDNYLTDEFKETLDPNLFPVMRDETILIPFLRSLGTEGKFKRKVPKGSTFMEEYRKLERGKVTYLTKSYRKDKETDLRILTFRAYSMMGIVDMLCEFTSPQLKEDLKELINNKIIEHKKRLKTHKNDRSPIESRIILPYTITIDTSSLDNIDVDEIEFYIALEVCDITALNGVSSLWQMLNVYDLSTEDKTLMDEYKTCMHEGFLKHPHEMRRYSLGDLKIIDIIIKANEYKTNLYQDLGIPDYDIGARKLNVGSENNDLQQKNLYYYIVKEVPKSSKELKESVEFNKMVNDIISNGKNKKITIEKAKKKAYEKLLTKYKDKRKEFIKKFQYCNANTYHTIYKNNTVSLQGKVVGGRIINMDPTFISYVDETMTKMACDIDLKGAYAQSMKHCHYFKGIPFLSGIDIDYENIKGTYPIFEKAYKLKHVLNRYEKILDLKNGNFVFTIEARNLKKIQNLIPSNINQGILTADKILDKRLKTTEKDKLDFKSGNSIYLKHEIINGIFTTNELRTLRNLGKGYYNYMLNNIYVTSVGIYATDRIAFYNDENKDQYPKVTEEKFNNVKFDNIPILKGWVTREILNPSYDPEKKSKVKQKLTYNELSNEDKIVEAFSLSDTLIEKLSDMREIAKDNRDEDGNKSPYEEFLKLLINTTYGTMISTEFDFTNLLVGNLITSKVRCAIYEAELILGFKISVTDGGIFIMEKVIHPTKKGELRLDKFIHNKLSNTELEKQGYGRYAPLPFDRSITNIDELKTNIEKSCSDYIDLRVYDSILVNDGFEFEIKGLLRSAIIHGKGNYEYVTINGDIGIYINEEEQSSDYENTQDEVSIINDDYNVDFNIEMPEEEVVLKTKKKHRGFKDHLTYHIFNIDYKQLEKYIGCELPEDHTIFKHSKKTKTFNPITFKHGFLGNNKHYDECTLIPSCIHEDTFLKSNVWSAKNRLGVKIRNSGMFLGDYFMKVKNTRYLTITQFNFNYFTQYKSLDSLNQKLINKYGLGVEIYFIDDNGKLRYQECLKIIDFILSNNCMTFSQERLITEEFKFYNKVIDKIKPLHNQLENPVIKKYIETLRLYRMGVDEFNKLGKSIIKKDNIGFLPIDISDNDNKLITQSNEMNEVEMMKKHNLVLENADEVLSSAFRFINYKSIGKGWILPENLIPNRTVNFLTRLYNSIFIKRNNEILRRIDILIAQYNELNDNKIKLFSRYDEQELSSIIHILNMKVKTVQDIKNILNNIHSINSVLINLMKNNKTELINELIDDIYNLYKLSYTYIHICSYRTKTLEVNLTVDTKDNMVNDVTSKMKDIIDGDCPIHEDITIIKNIKKINAYDFGKVITKKFKIINRKTKKSYNDIDGIKKYCIEKMIHSFNYDARLISFNQLIKQLP